MIFKYGPHILGEETFWTGKRDLKLAAMFVLGEFQFYT